MIKQNMTKAMYKESDQEEFEANTNVSSNEQSNVKTMFVSHEKDVGKKPFQKPNILRRKAKVPAQQSDKPSFKESLRSKSLTSTHVDEPTIADQHVELVTEENNKQIITKSVLKLTIANNNVEESNVNEPQETVIDANVKSSAISSSVIELNSIDKGLEQGSLNIESFINGGASDQILPLSNIDVIPLPETKTTQAKTKWCYDLSNNPMDVMINNYNVTQSESTEQKSHFLIDVVPSANSTSVHQPSKKLHEVICSTTPTRTVSVEFISNRAVKFKCDEPNCSKGFWSEERLKKHKKSHNKQSTTVRAPSQVSIGCPVKKTLEDGVEQKCPETFQVRSELLKHLDADHTPEDALYRCEVCGRRFFWASGLRAHAHSLCARGGLACAWPGCGRVFRLPCRLREHARAHTGDRPYVCTYPDCGWAFRSASKLVRHARRHTDERRHVCGACGRGFLRREHLRDHAARHHAPHARPTHICPHAGCEQSFTNMSTLYMHMKKVHKKEEVESVVPADTDPYPDHPDSVELETGENVYLVSVVEPTEGAASGGDLWTHAARTHCTWPLTRTAPRESYALSDDAHAENGEGSANDIRVRSDLFLHGNPPIDDDSQNIGEGAIAETAEEEAPHDTDLCLIDSHPTIDLMQEELMYEDAAVDESSFRVFLLNGEELS